MVEVIGDFMKIVENIKDKKRKCFGFNYIRDFELSVYAMKILNFTLDEGCFPSVKEIFRLGVPLNVVGEVLEFLREDVKIKWDKCSKLKLSTFDELSRIVADVYVKEKKIDLAILVAKYGFPVRLSKELLSFINNISEEANESFYGFIENLSEEEFKFFDKLLLKYLDLGIPIERNINIDLLSLASKLKTGVFTVRLMLAYLSWVLSSYRPDISKIDVKTKMRIENVSREIVDVLDRVGGNVIAASRELGVSLRDVIAALYLLESYGLLKTREIVGLPSMKIEGKISFKVPKIDLREVRKETKDIFVDVCVRRGFDFSGGYVRFKVAVENKGNVPVSRVNVILNIPDGFRVGWIEPRGYRRGGNIVDIGVLESGETKSLTFYLEPLVCGKSVISGVITYMDPLTKEVRSIGFRSEEVEVKCPLFFTVEKANLAKVRNLLDTVENRDDRRYTIPEGLAAVDIFKMLKGIMRQFDIKEVGEIVISVEPFSGEVYYYGVTKYLNNPVAVRVFVDDKNRALIIDAATAYKEQLIGLLSEISNKLMKSLVEKKIIGDMKDLKPLRCPDCGAKWERLPSPDKPLKCRICLTTFTEI